MKRIYGLFTQYKDADSTIIELGNLGYKNDDVDVLAKDSILKENTVSATEGGAATGALVGGLAGLFVGIPSVAVPVLGPVVAIGTILGSTAVGAGLGAGTGALVGAFIDLGMPEPIAQTYVSGIEEGGILVVVNAKDEDEKKVKSIMSDNNVTNLAVYAL